VGEAAKATTPPSSGSRTPLKSHRSKFFDTLCGGISSRRPGTTLHLADYGNAYAHHNQALTLFRRHAGPEALRTLSR
jgi:hypothetical protein